MPEQNDLKLSWDIILSMDMAVLKRINERCYEFYGLAPSFYSKIFPSGSDNAPCVSPWLHSYMLEFFLEEAENFFCSSPLAGQSINSGIWLETKEQVEYPLVAKAQKTSNAEIIIIRAIFQEYAERLKFFHKARVEIIERRKIGNDLNSFKVKAMSDALTKLYNRGAFCDFLETNLPKMKGFDTNLALLMLDIDFFKKVNDTYGHLAGDSVLVQLAEILKSSLRKDDYPARYGGEEFAIIAPDTNLKQSRMLAEKLRKRVESHDFKIGSKVTISIGCTVYRLNESLDSFVDRADSALYDAKHNGRNQVCVRDPWSELE